MSATVTVQAKELARATVYVVGIGVELERCAMELRALGSRMETAAARMKADWLEATGVAKRVRPIQPETPEMTMGGEA